MSDQRRLPYLKGRIQENTQSQIPQEQQPKFQDTRPTPPLQQQQPQQQPQLTKDTSSQSQTTLPQPLQPGLRNVPKKQSRIDTELIPRPSLKAEDSVMYQLFKSTPTPLYHPPMSFQYFLTEDDGNVGPRFMRSSVYALGNEASIINQTELPLGIIVQPLADPGTYEQSPPLVEFPCDPVRCGRCKTYMNPYMQFTDGGNSFICNICRFVTRVPNEYYTPLGGQNIRTDKFDKPELNKGCYDILAPAEYIKKPIGNSLLLFCIELTHQTVQMGVFLQVIQSISAILDSIQCPERTDVAFITFDQRMHFYNIPQNLASEPQLVIVSELDEVNIPLPREKLFMNIANERDKINYLIEKLQKQAEVVAQTKPVVGVPLLTTLNNACQMIAPKTGRVLVFTHQFPTIGMGKLTQRRIDPKNFGTDSEKQFYVPQNQEFITLGTFCQKNHITVDLWLFNEHQHDLATLIPLPAMTGGELNFYQQYDPIVNGEELYYQLFRNLTRSFAFDCIMTLRLSNGLILNEYITGAGKIPVRDLEIPYIHADTSIAIYFKQEDKINETEAYLQYALLYSNLYGQRMIRVMNLQLQVVNKSNNNNPWHNIFKTSDVDACFSLMLRSHLHQFTQQSIKQIRVNLFNNLVNILHAYRKYCSSSSPHGQLILPENIKTMPVLLQGVLKRDALRQGTIRIDSRINDIFLLITTSPLFVNNYLYPKIYPIRDIQHTLIQEMFQLGQIIEENKIVMPASVAATVDKLNADGVYLIDTSAFIYVYVMRETDESLLNDVQKNFQQTLYIKLFGVQNVDALLQLQIEQLINNPDNEVNQRVQNMIDQLRRNKCGSYQPIKIVVHNTNAAAFVLSQFVEDEQRQEKSYGDFLCDIHASIQSKGI